MRSFRPGKWRSNDTVSLWNVSAVSVCCGTMQFLQPQCLPNERVRVRAKSKQGTDLITSRHFHVERSNMLCTIDSVEGAPEKKALAILQ